MFEKFPSLTRFSHDWTITEKIDGTNAQILITRDGRWYQREGRVAWGNQEFDDCILDHLDGFFLYAGSRTRFLTPKNDNFGFANWAQANAQKLIDVLGEGRHFGEWCGLGIQRTYNLNTKKFVLFNTHRWVGIKEKFESLDTVPVLDSGYMDNPGATALRCMDELKTKGSAFSPGFMNPEGVVMRHNPSGTVFKKTFDYDEYGKWKENQERKQTSLDNLQE